MGKLLKPSVPHFLSPPPPFLKILFIRERVREHEQEGQREREKESQANSMLTVEPDKGLDLMTPGS